MYLRPLSEGFGAEIEGLDLRNLTDFDWHWIEEAWVKYSILVFHEQQLSCSQLLHFSEKFGRPLPYAYGRQLADYPEISVVEKRPEDRGNFGGAWHSDSPYLEAPPIATCLMAVSVPSKGGNTVFSNQYAAYDNLPEAMKVFVDGATGVFSKTFRSDLAKEYSSLLRQFVDGLSPRSAESIHPLVVVHPSSGRKALYVSWSHTREICGLSHIESRRILDELCRESERVEHRCEVIWKERSVAIWDNRCTLHLARNDYPGFHRVMHRVTIGAHVQ